MKQIKILSMIVLIISVALLGLTSCDVLGNIIGQGDQSQDEHVHVFSDATCTTPKTCECGATEGDPLGHSFVEGKCTCGAEDSDYTPPHTHAYESVVTSPDCVNGGYTTYTCACGDSYVADEVAALGHSYKSVVTAPTCTESGYTTYTCACGDSYVGDSTDALGHDYNATVTAPTCTESGYTTYTCECGDTYNSNVVNAKHSFDANGVCASCNGEIAVTNPVVSKPYIFGMTQGNLQNKVYYLKGGMNGYYMETTANPAEALFVYLEQTQGGYYMYCFVNGQKTYINMVVSGTHVNGAYEATPSTVYTIDEAHHTVIADVNGSDYWFGTRNDKTYTTAGPCAVSYAGFYCEFYDAHIHSYEKGDTTAPTCTEAGYTTYTCSCGDNEKRDSVSALGHSFEKGEITPPTCTEQGYTTYVCACGSSEIRDTVDSLGHSYTDGKCACGAEDPNYESHVHDYKPEVTTQATCSVAGVMTYTCACADSYTEEIPVADHIDTNLDITCDFEGCTKRILPPADSKVSLFTAQHMIIVSLSNNYYFEGVITNIYDTKNGIFTITDDEGYSVLIRLPKDEAGTSYASWTTKVVIGDTIQVYGKPTQNTSSTYSEKAKIESGVLTVLKHEHVFSDPTCADESICACLVVNAPALGHIDEDGDNVCDRCPWKMNMGISKIVVATDTTISNGVVDEAKTFWTWSDDNFDVVIAKGTSTFTLYTTAKAYMQLKKLNTLTVESKSDYVMKSITIYASNAAQLTNLQAAIGTAYTYTVDAESFSVTIEWNSADDFSFSNAGSNTVYISGVEVVYEK